MAVSRADKAIDNARLTMAHWGERVPPGGGDYYSFPPLVAYHTEAVTGRQQPYSQWWCEDFICDAYLPPCIENLISLCCGFGDVERYLAQRGLFRHCIGYDISPGAIAGARQHAAEASMTSIRYEQADLNHAELLPESADVIWANGALHHIERLEHAIAETCRALKPGGMLVAVEYVGPDHQRPTQRQHELINAMIHVLPPRWRPAPRTRGAIVRHFMNGRGAGPKPRGARFRVIKRLLYEAGAASARCFPAHGLTAPWRYDASYFATVDPSEGVRASAIIPTVRAAFPDTEIRCFHGSLLRYALGPGFYESFDPGSAGDRALLHSLVEIERHAIARGELVSENAVIVARKTV